MIPFSAIRKKSVVAMQLPETEVVRVYVKGAPEYLIRKCTKVLSEDGSPTNMTDEDIQTLLNNVLYTEYTSKGYRGLGFAYKDYTLSDFEDL